MNWFGGLFLFAIFVLLPIVLVRGYGASIDAQLAWPAGRVLWNGAQRIGEGPFREATIDREVVVREVSAGLPWSLTVLLGPAAMLCFCWGIAAALLLLEFCRALWTFEIAWPLLPGLGFAIMRTLTGTMVFGSMCVREGKQAAVTAALTLMLDGLLYCFAIQITAARSEDRLVALLGLSLHALLAIVYFVEHTRRRNLVPTVVAAVNEDE